MKIEKVEKNEKPDYDTKNERKNKFLRLVCDHKKMIIVILVALIIAICGVAFTYYYNSAISGMLPYNWKQQMSKQIDEVNDKVKEFEGEVSSFDIKKLVWIVKTYNENKFPDQYEIVLNIDDSLKSYGGDAYVEYKDVKYYLQTRKKYNVEIISYDKYGCVSLISIRKN